MSNELPSRLVELVLDGGRVNAVEIEEAVSELAAAPFDANEFPFAFLQAFGNKDTTVRRLRARSDMIDPAVIDSRKPRWEAFKAETDERVRLDQQRKGLLDYQEKLDHARERLDKGGMTDKELTRMQDDLRTSMPDAVRQKVGLENERPKVVPSLSPAPAALPDGMDALMKQTGLAPAPMTGPRL